MFCCYLFGAPFAWRGARLALWGFILLVVPQLSYKLLPDMVLQATPQLQRSTTPARSILKPKSLRPAGKPASRGVTFNLRTRRAGSSYSSPEALLAVAAAAAAAASRAPASSRSRLAISSSGASSAASSRSASASPSRQHADASPSAGGRPASASPARALTAEQILAAAKGHYTPPEAPEPSPEPRPQAYPGVRPTSLTMGGWQPRSVVPQPAAAPGGVQATPLAAFGAPQQHAFSSMSTAQPASAVRQAAGEAAQRWQPPQIPPPPSAQHPAPPLPQQEQQPTPWGFMPTPGQPFAGPTPSYVPAGGPAAAPPLQPMQQQPPAAAPPPMPASGPVIQLPSARPTPMAPPAQQQATAMGGMPQAPLQQQYHSFAAMPAPQARGPPQPQQQQTGGWSPQQGYHTIPRMSGQALAPAPQQPQSQQSPPPQWRQPPQPMPQQWQRPQVAWNGAGSVSYGALPHGAPDTMPLSSLHGTAPVDQAQPILQQGPIQIPYPAAAPGSAASDQQQLLAPSAPPRPLGAAASPSPVALQSAPRFEDVYLTLATLELPCTQGGSTAAARAATSFGGASGSGATSGADNAFGVDTDGIQAIIDQLQGLFDAQRQRMDQAAALLSPQVRAIAIFGSRAEKEGRQQLFLDKQCFYMHSSMHVQDFYRSPLRLSFAAYLPEFTLCRPCPALQKPGPSHPPSSATAAPRSPLPAPRSPSLGLSPARTPRSPSSSGAAAASLDALPAVPRQGTILSPPQMSPQGSADGPDALEGGAGPVAWQSTPQRGAPPVPEPDEIPEIDLELSIDQAFTFLGMLVGREGGRAITAVSAADPANPKYRQYVSNALHYLRNVPGDVPASLLQLHALRVVMGAKRAAQRKVAAAKLPPLRKAQRELWRKQAQLVQLRDKALEEEAARQARSRPTSPAKVPSEFPFVGNSRLVLPEADRCTNVTVTAHRLGARGRDCRIPLTLTTKLHYQVSQFEPGMTQLH